MYVAPIRAYPIRMRIFICERPFLKIRQTHFLNSGKQICLRQPRIEDTHTKFEVPKKECVEGPADYLSLGAANSEGVFLR
jgi:hypothetical protein